MQISPELGSQQGVGKWERGNRLGQRDLQQLQLKQDGNGKV